MANGYYRLAGKPAAVMVHVTVGTANTVCGLMNMARDNVPVMLCAGRTPITETGNQASRNGAIHWGQESFDQGGMVREFVKWDYELRTGQPPGALVDRALDIAMSEPRGPVYMCLPREVLASEAASMRRDNVRPLGVEPAEPARNVIESAAHILAKAEYPLIVTAALGRSVEAFDALAALAKDFAIPVVQPFATDLSLATDHPMFCGFELGPHLAQADAVLVINSGVPWMPRMAKPKPATKVIHMAVDPLVSRHPFREFEADLMVAGDPVAGLVMLRESLAGLLKDKKGDRGAAQDRGGGAHRPDGEARQARRLGQGPDPDPSGLARALPQPDQGQGRGGVNELGVPPSRLDLTAPLSFIGSEPRGRPRRRAWHGARRQARGAGARGDRLRRRRLLHVRQSGAGAFRCPRRKPADADRCCQQSFLAGGTAVDALGLSGWRRLQGQRDADPGSQSVTGIRKGDRIVRRGRRKGRGTGGACCRAQAQLWGASLRHAGAAQRVGAGDPVSTEC